MPAVCTICAKHMVGREGHVEGCACVLVRSQAGCLKHLHSCALLCVCLCVCLASLKKVLNTLTFGEGMFI